MNETKGRLKLVGGGGMGEGGDSKPATFQSWVQYVFTSQSNYRLISEQLGRGSSAANIFKRLKACGPPPNIKHTA